MPPLNLSTVRQMLYRRCHFWLCCFPGQLEQYLNAFAGTPFRVQRAKTTPGKFGPYDYIFIDSDVQDAPIDFMVRALLDHLEPRKHVLVTADTMTSGIEITVKTDDLTYREAMDPATFGRLARLKMGVNFSFEHLRQGEHSTSQGR